TKYTTKVHVASAFGNSTKSATQSLAAVGSRWSFAQARRHRRYVTSLTPIWRVASAMGCPCATSSSTCRNAIISYPAYPFLAIAVLLDVKRHTSSWTTSMAADHDANSVSPGYHPRVAYRDGLLSTCCPPPSRNGAGPSVETKACRSH